MKPNQLSRELRTHDTPWLANRRRIVGLSLTAAQCMELIALYQMGLIRHLPEPPLPGMDADKVDAASEAYERTSTPDAFLGLASYAVTAGLAAMGGKNRAVTHPWIPVLMGAKAFVDAAQAGKLTWDQWARHRAFCFWCLTATGATLAILPLAMPEAFAGLKKIVARRRSRAAMLGPK